MQNSEQHPLPSYSTRPSSPTEDNASNASDSPLSTPSALPDLWAADYAELADDALPQYTRRDPQNKPRKFSDPRDSITPAMAEVYREHHRDQMAKRARIQQQQDGPIEKWVRWSAKFYMPMLGRWDHRRSA